MILQQVNVAENYYMLISMLIASDYIPGPFNVTFTAGEIGVELEIFLINDSILENDEDFHLVIDRINLPGGLTIGNHDTTVVTIIDDDGKCYY